MTGFLLMKTVPDLDPNPKPIFIFSPNNVTTKGGLRVFPFRCVVRS